MKRYLCAFSTMIFALGCSSEPSPASHTLDHASGLYPSAPSLQFEPLERVGCERNLLEREPVADYLDAVSASPAATTQAEAALVTMYRQLRCMSSRDFATNYTSLMDYIEGNYTPDQTELAPLVLTLREAGAWAIDARTSSWLARASRHLKEEHLQQETIAAGVGLHFANGLSLVRFQPARALTLIEAFSTPSFRVASCTMKSVVFFEGEGENTSPVAVCLNDPCPALAGALPSNLASRADIMAHCANANAAFDAAKEVASGHGVATPAGGGGGGDQSGGGGSGPNGGFNEGGDDIFTDVMDCISQFNQSNGADYACAVQVGAQNTVVHNSFSQFQTTDSVKVGIDFKINAKACSPNPLGDGPSDGEWKPEDYELDTFWYYLEDIKGHLDMANEANDALTEMEAQGITSGEEYDAQLELLNKVFDLPPDGPVEEARSRLQGLNDALEQWKDIYRETYEAYKRKYGEEPNWPHPDSAPEAVGCQNEGSGCSSECNINEQIAVESSQCLGMNVGAPEVEVGEWPTGNPEVMYPVPEDAAGDSALATLNQCLAEALGMNTAEDQLEEGDSCGELILCTNSTTSIVDENQNCSCGAAGADAYGFGYGWGDLYACEQTILCTEDQSACGCGSIEPSAQVDAPGGIPTNPEVFMRIPSEHFTQAQ